MIKKIPYTVKHYIALILYSFLVMLLCTKSSPIYVLNDWYNANVYYTMGRGLVNGAVLYNELFDHKGPFLYLIYAIGYLISNNNFFGVFILQVIAMSITLICSFQIAKLYTSNDKASFMISILMPVSILTSNFYVSGRDLGGGSPDEFVIPIFLLIMYLVVRLIKCDILLEKPFITFFSIGILSSLIFQLKFNYLSLVIGLLAPIFVYMLVKKFVIFIKSSLLFCGGFILTLIPYLTYSLITNSLRDFLQVYIKFNKVYASKEGKNLIYSLAVASRNAVNTMLGRNMLIFVIIFLGLLYFLYSHKDEFIFNLSVILSFSLSIIVVSIVPFEYGYINIMAFSLLGYISLYEIINKLGKQLNTNNTSKYPYSMGIYITSLLIIFCFTIANNGLICEDLNKVTQRNVRISCQRQVADIICSDGNEEHSLLEVLNIDSGFYTALGIVPKSRYFYIPNAPFYKYPYAYIGQYEDVKSRLNEYVISPFEANYKEEIELQPMNSENCHEKITNAIAMNYSLVKTIQGTYLQGNTTFYLYRRLD